MKIPCYWRRNACGTVLACGMTLSWGLLSNAQFHDPVWTSGSTQITFPHGDVTQVQVQDLPTPTNANIPAQFRYSGAVANTCQYGQYDREGKLLFFIVDGNFYNADGYLIADAALSPNDLDCSTCFYPGQEIHVYPVPGSCSRYFVFSLYSVFPDGSFVFQAQGLLRKTLRRFGGHCRLSKKDQTLSLRWTEPAEVSKCGGGINWNRAQQPFGHVSFVFQAQGLLRKTLRRFGGHCRLSKKDQTLSLRWTEPAEVSKCGGGITPPRKYH
ncbi:MAG TPA: hypothetical protein PLS30_09990 [Flavobacteriales bacterium]|jgi:hypothetical protein|nr:hypothetical protein [Flavobacteriales bacterium]MBK8532015.1 hypothetical protein [Flavobacteriales bacterium]MBK8707801.1 hypothetical protein [Flavobacteriales bacterium]HQW04532.1 hypothetical protein [Flavobacteriales bacterium]HQW99268.1 hypothetical protein [Flavobacteriales bacterium]